MNFDFGLRRDSIRRPEKMDIPHTRPAEDASLLTSMLSIHSLAGVRKAAAAYVVRCILAGCFSVAVLYSPAIVRASDSLPCSGSQLDLSGYRPIFGDEFNDLSVSADGPGTRWYTRTEGDFGDARFVDPSPGFPFSASRGVLTIQARKFPDGWRSGILASVDPAGRGFSQQYGYFEMRAKFPKGPGTWPAFWMLTTGSLTNPKQTTFEADIVEEYGHDPETLFTTIHWWPPAGSGSHRAIGAHCHTVDMSRAFHTYGLLWTQDTLTWYLDRHAVWSQPTPPEARVPMYLLVNLALGSGWPITHTPNPSAMLVDYVRAYAKAPPS